jgi:hypothetical protein
MYSNEDALTLKDFIAPRFNISFEELRPLIQTLPKMERDLLYLYFFVQKSQEEIAVLFGLTQGGVSYRIKRTIQRLQFILSLPPVDFQEMQTDLLKVLSEEQVKLLCLMSKSSSQTVTGVLTGLSQGRVRYRFLKAIELLKSSADVQPRFKVYVEYFTKISENFNILRVLASKDYKDVDFMESLEYSVRM